MRILIVDDEENIRRTTAVLLDSEGHHTVEAATGDEAIAQLEKAPFDLAFLDLRLGDESGLTLIPQCLKICPQLDIVVFTAFASIESAVEAMRKGAADFIPKPFTPEQIRLILEKSAKRRRLQGRLADLESRLSSISPEVDLTTDEPSMRKVFDVAFKAAVMPTTILILGESGTGKSVLARAIHENSPQRDNAFVTLACPSLSRDLLESDLFGHLKGSFTGAVGDTWGKVAKADGGTLFLDEIGELPLEIQPKLLRLLQEKEYERVGETKLRKANVRVVAATNRDLEQEVKNGTFREDLYYRINVISVKMPPLRERKADLSRIAALCLRFCAAECGKKTLRYSPEVEEAILSYTWPGNLRELRNVIERAVILADRDTIELSDLPEEMVTPHFSTETDESISTVRLGAQISLQEIENEHIRKILQSTQTLEAAARILGIDSATLYRRRKKIGL